MIWSILILLFSPLLWAGPTPEFKAIPQVEITQTTPSCQILRHRLMQERKLFLKWQSLNDQVHKLSPSAPESALRSFENERNQLTERLHSALGFRKDQLIYLHIFWDLPRAYAQRINSSTIVQFRTPGRNWRSPMDQILPEFRFSRSQKSSVEIHLRLTPIQFCLDNPIVVLEMGAGFLPPYETFTESYFRLTADLTESRESAFHLSRVEK